MASQRWAEIFRGGWGGGGPPLGVFNPPPTEGGAGRARLEEAMYAKFNKILALSSDLSSNIFAKIL